MSARGEVEGARERGGGAPSNAYYEPWLGSPVLIDRTKLLTDSPQGVAVEIRPWPVGNSRFSHNNYGCLQKSFATFRHTHTLSVEICFYYIAYIVFI